MGSPLRKDLLISAGEYSHRPASVIISCSDIFALVLTCCSALFLPAGPIKFCFGCCLSLKTLRRPRSIGFDRFCVVAAWRFCVVPWQLVGGTAGLVLYHF